MFEPLLGKLNSLCIVVATGSKQKQDVLRTTGLKFKNYPSSFDESLDKDKYSVGNYVVETAFGKVNDVSEQLKNEEVKADIVIGLDTMVFFDGKMFGKPTSANDAEKTLQMFMANTNLPVRIYTGVVINYNGQIEKFFEYADVYLAKLSNEEIESYVKTAEPMGKAGSFAIQGLAASFVRRIEGDYNTVIGLPLCAITEKLKMLVNT